MNMTAGSGALPACWCWRWPAAPWLRSLEEPQLDVVDVQMLRGDLLQQQLRVRMRVQNPNDRALPVRRITYEVAVAGRGLRARRIGARLRGACHGEAEFDVSVTANAAAAVLRLLGGGRKLDDGRLPDHRQGDAVPRACCAASPSTRRATFKLR